MSTVDEQGEFRLLIRVNFEFADPELHSAADNQRALT